MNSTRSPFPAAGARPAWHERGDFLGDIAVIRMNPDHGKRIAHQLQALGIPHLLMAMPASLQAQRFHSAMRQSSSINNRQFSP